MTPPPLSPDSKSVDDTHTSLPIFRTWRSVYAAVLVILVLWIGALTWLTQRYS